LERKEGRKNKGRRREGGGVVPFLLNRFPGGANMALEGSHHEILLICWI
jgi:hypothetical protein